VSKSDDIRALARDGFAVADIARRVGVRYQHAYNVLKAAGMLSEARSNVATRAGIIGGERAPGARAASPPSARPLLTAELLLRASFEHSARWILVDGALVLDQPLPKNRGVYAFVKNGVALYVGLATMGLAKRLYFYGKPGVTQRTSQRVNELLKVELLSAPYIDIYTATPSNLEWNGLPVSGDAGLELGLIETFSLPWNIRGVRA
jgi:hypothetical protein